MTPLKIFAADEILTAEDVNDHLNPATAPHIPFAVYARELFFASVPAGSTAGGPYPLPPGRFTAPPLVLVSLRTLSSGSGGEVTVGGFAPDVDTLEVLVRNRTSNNQLVRVHVLAIQMTPDSAAG